jgi:DNA replication protein DnaC
MGLSEERERELVAEATAGGGFMARVSSATLARAIRRDPARADLFDLSDPDCPVLVRRCARCREKELRYPCPGGVPPLTLQLVARAMCEVCLAAVVAEEEARAGAVEVQKRIRESGIPASLAAQAAWKNLIAEGRKPEETTHRTRAIEQAQAWAKEKEPHPRGLYIYAPEVGTGKTLLAATAALERMKHSPVRWVSVAVLVAQLEGAWADTDRQAALKALTDSGAVVLDDVDKIPQTPKVRAQIFAAIEARDQKKAPIIITSNLGPKQLEQTIGEAATSRLAGPCERLPYPGPDRRLEFDAGPVRRGDRPS